jgi:hypothetical protein
MLFQRRMKSGPLAANNTGEQQHHFTAHTAATELPPIDRQRFNHAAFVRALDNVSAISMDEFWNDYGMGSPSAFSKLDYNSCRQNATTKPPGHGRPKRTGGRAGSNYSVIV